MADYIYDPLEREHTEEPGPHGGDRGWWRCVPVHRLLELPDDPEIVRLWRDYRHVTGRGNPTGMTFARYVAERMGPPPIVSATGTGSVVARSAVGEWR